MNKSKRIFYFDALRAFAIIGIVFCHASISFVITGISSPSFCISAFFDCFREFSIPIFVMLSGALLLNRKDSLTAFFKKRLSRILIPFLFWAIIYILYSFAYVSGTDWGVAIDIFFGTSSTMGVTFWFVWMIIIAYVGIFIINKLIDFGSTKVADFDRKFITALTILSLLYIISVNFGFFNPYEDRLIYFVSFMSYIIIGYFLANSDILESLMGPNSVVVMTFVFSIASYLFYIFGYVVPRSVANNQFIFLGYFNILILFMSVNIFLLFKYASKTRFFGGIENKPLGKWITQLSKYSFGIYLAHYIILHGIKVNLLRVIDLNSQNPLIWIPLLVIFTVVICLIILKMLNKIPYLNKASGVG